VPIASWLVTWENTDFSWLSHKHSCNSLGLARKGAGPCEQAQFTKTPFANRKDSSMMPVLYLPWIYHRW